MKNSIVMNSQLENQPVTLPPMNSFIRVFDVYQVNAKSCFPQIESDVNEETTTKVNHIREIQKQLTKKVKELKASVRDLVLTQSILLELESLLNMLNTGMKVVKSQHVELSKKGKACVLEHFIFHNDRVLVPQILFGIQQIMIGLDSQIQKIRSSTYKIAINTTTYQLPPKQPVE